MCDARQRPSCRDALIALVEHSLQVLRNRTDPANDGDPALTS
jgi:hypothetical protein